MYHKFVPVLHGCTANETTFWLMTDVCIKAETFTGPDFGGIYTYPPPCCYAPCGNVLVVIVVTVVCVDMKLTSVVNGRFICHNNVFFIFIAFVVAVALSLCMFVYLCLSVSLYVLFLVTQ